MEVLILLALYAMGMQHKIREFVFFTNLMVAYLRLVISV